MARDRERRNIKQEARIAAFKMALGVLTIIVCAEFAIIVETKIKIEGISCAVVIAIPLIGALISFFIFKNMCLEEERYRLNTDYVQQQVEEENFVQVNSSEPSNSFLLEKVDMVAVRSQEEDVVIVAMSHNDDIIAVKELPKEQFDEEYNIINEED